MIKPMKFINNLKIYIKTPDPGNICPCQRRNNKGSPACITFTHHSDIYIQ